MDVQNPSNLSSYLVKNQNSNKIEIEYSVSIQIFQLRQQGWLNKEGGREGGGVSNQLIKPK